MRFLDTDILPHALALKKKKVSKRLKWFVLIGIGGSDLGTKAVYDALFGAWDVLDPYRFPKMIFADTVSADLLDRLSVLMQDLVSPQEILINIVSKSGTTLETVANAEAVLAALRRRFADVGDRVVATTDRGSKLWQWAEDHGVSRLAIPDEISGRFSVFTAVGLFPLACVGADVKALLSGAKSVRPTDAAKSALLVHEQIRRRKTIHVLFVFDPALESLGKWWRQLAAESLGKRGRGFMPVVSIGSTDLHSVAQLYLDGPRNVFTTFLSVADGEDVTLPRSPALNGLADAVRGRSTRKITHAILHGVQAAYRKKKLPFTSVILPWRDEKSLGAFMQFKMLETIFLAKLLKVNAFDQPAVEAYKKEVRKMLK